MELWEIEWDAKYPLDEKLIAIWKEDMLPRKNQGGKRIAARWGSLLRMMELAEDVKREIVPNTGIRLEITMHNDYVKYLANGGRKIEEIIEEVHPVYEVLVSIAPCHYCDSSKRLSESMHYVEDGYLVIEHESGYTESVKIKNCPMCGKEL